MTSNDARTMSAPDGILWSHLGATWVSVKNLAKTNVLERASRGPVDSLCPPSNVPRGGRLTPDLNGGGGTVKIPKLTGDFPVRDPWHSVTEPPVVDRRG